MQPSFEDDLIMDSVFGLDTIDIVQIDGAWLFFVADESRHDQADWYNNCFHQHTVIQSRIQVFLSKGNFTGDEPSKSGMVIQNSTSGCSLALMKVRNANYGHAPSPSAGMRPCGRWPAVHHR